MINEKLILNFNFKFEDLYKLTGLIKIDKFFLDYLKIADANLADILVNSRSKLLNKTAYSKLIINVAPYLEDFISELFAIQSEVTTLTQNHNNLSALYQCKRLFIQRRVSRKYSNIEAANFSLFELTKQLEKLIGKQFNELEYAKQINYWLLNEQQYSQELIIASKYAYLKLYYYPSCESILFKLPAKLNFENLIKLKKTQINELEVFQYDNQDIQGSINSEISLTKALDQANYCIYCHNQNKDSCSIGLKDGDNHYKKNSFAQELTGCPLEEKISEMNYLKAKGLSIGSLATAMIDNPLVAATGYRICNDCMKSCIYQKQEPVNIPQIESQILKDVLNLNWGFEIYSLLTRWNPLNLTNYLPKVCTNYRVLIVGLGPAGFNLAHHLLNDGHLVVAVDGLKIEPLPSEIAGIDQEYKRQQFKPIKNIYKLFTPIKEREAMGFGGVAEYGITARWNKNYLKIIRLLLERRENFIMFGGVRFGSQLNYQSSFNLGFNHIALATGAAKPNLLNIDNSLAKGIRLASDFLMSIQLTGADKKDSISNLQLRLPIIIIGGGLTAVDCATESIRYYFLQIEKFLTRYQQLVEKIGQSTVEEQWNEEEKLIAQEFINHAKEARIAKANNYNLTELINSWGGVTVIYRQKLIDSPAYRLNYEEVALAMQEGVNFAELLTPLTILVDKYQHIEALLVKNKLNKEQKILTKAIIIAVGTKPNNIVAEEDFENFKLSENYLEAIDEFGNAQSLSKNHKDPAIYILNSINKANQAVSFFGDLHPSFAGNVVKAMASSKRGFPIITRILKKLPMNGQTKEKFFDKIANQLLAKVKKVIKFNDQIFELIIEAPLAAKNFKPGQFYRLQNYSYLNSTKSHNIEPLALTGASVDLDKGLISLIVLNSGASSYLSQFLQIDEPVILMGPTGEATTILANKTVLLIGGGLGNAVLFSIGKALKAVNSKVLYFAAYRSSADCYKRSEIEEAADSIIWCTQEGRIEINRPQDISIQGNVIEGLAYYARQIDHQSIPLFTIDQIIAIGSNKMMEAVNIARNSWLGQYLGNHQAIASINSPMQCMMKQICAQCLQRHIDPLTKLETYIYSCSKQDQQMNHVDFNHLQQRLTQNSTQEKLTNLWLSKFSKLN